MTLDTGSESETLIEVMQICDTGLQTFHISDADADADPDRLLKKRDQSIRIRVRIRSSAR
jgi:hypothetical protein